MIHAGDITAHGSRDNFLQFLEWFSSRAHTHKIFIAGNHDKYLENNDQQVLADAKALGLIYLCDSGVEIDGVKFWGSPITPQFHDWSFMRSEAEIDQHWKLIPEGTDVLITHGPIWGVLDEVQRSEHVVENTGCPSLAKRVADVKPSFHVFGHIHECHGSIDNGVTRFLNVSTMNKNYKIQNAPVSFECKKNALQKEAHLEAK